MLHYYSYYNYWNYFLKLKKMSDFRLNNEVNISQILASVQVIWGPLNYGDIYEDNALIQCNIRSGSCIEAIWIFYRVVPVSQKNSSIGTLRGSALASPALRSKEMCRYTKEILFKKIIHNNSMYLFQKSWRMNSQRKHYGDSCWMTNATERCR